MFRCVLFAVVLLFPLQSFSQGSLPPATSLGDGWNAIPTEGVCSSGTPYQFYARTSSASDSLLIFYGGGGACWFGQACDLNSPPNVHSPFADMDSNNPARYDGIFSLDRNDNPFQNFNIVVLPYCTGDVHIGSGERIYTYTSAEGADVTVTTHHDGFRNSSTVLNWVYENFSAPERVVVSGSSAGAIGASFFAGLVAEHYGQSPVVLIADAAGGYNSPNLPVTFNAWQTDVILPDWPEYAGETNDTLTFEDFYIASANHNPNLTIAQYNAAEDQIQYNFSYLIGDRFGSFRLPERIFNHYVEIESATESFFHYTAGGDVHTIMGSDIFYTYEVEGVRFVDWVDDLIQGRPVRDISCVNDARGCATAPDEETP